MKCRMEDEWIGLLIFSFKKTLKEDEYFSFDFGIK